MELTETDVRIEILNSFLTTPHRDLEKLAPLHQSALERDPLFYAHLAPWYFKTGEVRDHKTLFVAHLALSPHPEFRSAAWMLLQRLAPYEVARVHDHIVKVCKKNVPRSLKGAIAHYLHQRESRPAQFDGAVLSARSDIKHLYAALHLRSSPRAHSLLFEGVPPEGSRSAALKLLARTEDAGEQARLIIEHHLPYQTAVAAVKQVTPALLVALVEVMTPAEVVNHMKLLKKRGALDHPELKQMVEAKLEAAKSDKRVSTMKASKAASAVQLDRETARKLAEVTDARVAAKRPITRPTALLVDKSTSMAAAIEVGKQLAALVGASVKEGVGLHVLSFDSAAFSIAPSGLPEGQRPQFSDWERAFRFMRADGKTSIGAPLAKLLRDRIRVEQVVIVTDEAENAAPRFVDAWKEYTEGMGVRPGLVLVTVGGRYEKFEEGLRAAGIEFSAYAFAAGGDYYSLANLVPLLAQPSQADLIDEIMGVPLPQRRQSARSILAQEQDAQEANEEEVLA